MNNNTLSVLKVGTRLNISSEELIVKPRFSVCKLRQVSTKNEYVAALKLSRPDVILVEHDCEGLDVNFILSNLETQNLKIPVILFINQIEETTALELIEKGLSDYLFLDKLKRLPNAIRQLVDKYHLYRQNEQRYQYLYDQNLAGLYVTSVKGILLECNVAFASMLGFASPKELIGQPVENLCLESGDRSVFIEALRKHGKLYNYENAVIRKDGTTIYSLENIYLAIDESSGEEICQGVVIDISQLVQTKQNITRARTMLAEGQKLAGMGNWNYNMRKRELTISTGLCDIFGLAKSSAVSLQKFLGMIDPGDRKQVLTSIMKLKEHGGKIRNNFKVVLDSGKIILVAAVHTQDLDENGRVLRYYGVIQDVTALDSAEKERDRITAELVKRNHALEQFTYVISHNLRAPVANIKALIEILEQSFAEKDEKEMIHRMSQSVANLDTVITDLNLILQIKQEQSSPKEVIDFESIIASIRLSIKNLIVQEHVQFELDIQCATSIVAVRSYLYSVFYNLTLNSIKYRNPLISPLIKIKCAEEGGDLVIRFQDNGKGIDLEKHGNELFGLYKRFDSGIEGKGLGLYMVKSQVQELGGTIEVESAIMKGTTFIIRIPGQLD
jgi:PAS domain S-box-containing protein